VSDYSFAMSESLLAQQSTNALAEQLHKSEKAIFEGRGTLKDYSNFISYRLEIQRRLWKETELNLADIVKQLRDTQSVKQNRS